MFLQRPCCWHSVRSKSHPVAMSVPAAYTLPYGITHQKNQMVRCGESGRLAKTAALGGQKSGYIDWQLEQPNPVRACQDGQLRYSFSLSEMNIGEQEI